MTSSKAAKRYASALLELAQEQNNLDAIVSDIVSIKETIDGSRDLQLLLKSPIIKPAEKTSALEAIFANHVGPLTLQFILLVSKKERTILLPEIARSLIKLYQKASGIIEVTLTSAFPLEDDKIAQIKKALETSTKKTVEFNIVENSALKGGITIQMEDTVIDGSVRHKLEQLEQTLLS